ncbi:hypothetical protein E4U42_001694 [Claviceps africana]|uniref:Ribosomal protein s17 n=1 Tax=Claviceps africana TaxID=83212 RepID=A0A8K0NJ35_9HYPO|nr:hypothetical protein E4U42_001694 [Claviceps africana]
MLFKAFIVSFFGLSVAVEAAQTSFRSPIARTLELRQQRGDQRGKNSGIQIGGSLGGNQGGSQGQNRKDDQGDNQGDNQGGNSVDDGRLALNPDLVQTASQDDGNNPGADGQAASATSNNNFINFCSGKTLTNGKQIKKGSCNGIPMGNIPATDRMVSSVFVNPQNGANLPANRDFKIQVQMINFKAGTFTNATSTYYSAPQDLDAQGNIIGHTHVTIQDTGKGLNPKRPLDPTQFAFFKGINDAGNGNGLLAADVTGGLPAACLQPPTINLCSCQLPSEVPRMTAFGLQSVGVPAAAAAAAAAATLAIMATGMLMATLMESPTVKVKEVKQIKQVKQVEEDEEVKQVSKGVNRLPMVKMAEPAMLNFLALRVASRAKHRMAIKVLSRLMPKAAGRLEPKRPARLKTNPRVGRTAIKQLSRADVLARAMVAVLQLDSAGPPGPPAGLRCDAWRIAAADDVDKAVLGAELRRSSFDLYR